MMLIIIVFCILSINVFILSLKNLRNLTIISCIEMLKNHELLQKVIQKQKFQMSKTFYKFYRYIKNQIIEKNYKELFQKNIEESQEFDRIFLKEGVVKQILKIADSIRKDTKKTD